MNWSIKQTIGVVVVALFLIFALLVSLIMIHDTKRLMLDAFNREQQVKVDVLGFSVSRAIEKNDYELLQYVVKKIKKDPAITAIEVLDTDGETIVRYPDFADRADADINQLESSQVITIRYPLRSKNDVVLGQLLLMRSNEIINSSIRHEIGMGLGALGISGTLFICLIFFFLNRIITSPLAKLSKAIANQASTSRKRSSIPYQNRTNEIGQLAKAFGLVFAELNYTTSDLKRSEGRLQAILDHSPAIITLQDRKGKYVLINKGGEELYDIPGQIVGKTDYDIVATEMANERQRQNQTILKSGKSIKVEELVRVEDREHTFLTIKFPLLNAQNEATAVCCIATDITSRKRDEADLARLALAIGQVTEMILISDDEGIIQYVNPAFENMTGQKSEEVFGCHLDLFTRSNNNDESADQRWQELAAGKIWQGRVVNKRKDGVYYECETIISPVRDQNGHITNFVAVSRDISREIRMEAQIHQGQKLKAIGELAAGIAHEINTPIQYIGDNLRFVRDAFASFNKVIGEAKIVAAARDDAAGDSTVTPEFQVLYDELDVEYLRTETPLAIEQSLAGMQRVIEIIAAMKNFAHPGSVKMTFVNLNAAIISTIAVARNEWKHVAMVETNLDQNLPSVPCLPGELNQVILNFLINAVHAIKDKEETRSQESQKGTIKISTILNNEWVDIVISDTGKGIADEDKARIFDPFFTTKKVGEGTGQGLAIANSVIVQKHHGVISFDSQLGRGTTFVVKLPLEQKMDG